MKSLESRPSQRRRRICRPILASTRPSPVCRGAASESTVDIFTIYVPHRHAYPAHMIKFMKALIYSAPLPASNENNYNDRAAFISTSTPSSAEIRRRYMNAQECRED